MQLFSLLVILEVISAGIILHTPMQSYPTLHHAFKSVLGAKFLAQDIPTDSPTPDENSNPTDTPVPDANDTSTEISPSPTDIPPQDSSNQDASAPTQSTTPQDTSSLSPDETSLINMDTASTQSLDQSAAMTPTPTQSSISSEIESPTPADTDTPTPTPNTSLIQDVNSISPDTNTDTAALNTNDVASSIPVNTDAVSQAQQQDKEINAATVASPEQTHSLIQAAKENIITMNDALTQNDYTTTSFLTQRVTDELTKAITNTQNPSPQDGKTLQDLQLFCKQADLSLKTEQLLVPQDLEQDIEIARGMCNSIQ